jgi:nitric oxide reductase subunit B
VVAGGGGQRLLSSCSAFCVLGWLAKLTYSGAPPIPERVVDLDGAVLFTNTEITAAQQVFLRYGLMENGTSWGHGAYLGPDFSAEYLHTLALDAERTVAERHGFVTRAALEPPKQLIVKAEVVRLLKQNRYNPVTRTLTFTQAESESYQRQIGLWTKYFSVTQNIAAFRTTTLTTLRSCTN